MKAFRRTVALATLASGLAAPAYAEAVAAHWDGYFYEEPRASARVLDEVQPEAKLDVQSCETGWCRVRYGEADGYVREEIVRGPTNEVHPRGSSTEATCFTAVQPGGGAWQDERFCRPRR